MGPTIFRDADATRKLLEYVTDSPGGKRSLSRIARTCRAFCEPALDMLWKELDSLLPLITQFPNHLFKRSRRPGLGLAIMPLEEDWSKILEYGSRVRRLTYDESSKSISPSIFPIIEEYRPRTYILPNLTTLIWRAETPAGLDRAHLFLNPDLQNLVLELGGKFPQLRAFLTDLSMRTRLASLSISSPSSLPDDFARLLRPQTELERVALMAPGALSPGVGRWASELGALRSLQVDLTGRSMTAVEGFFDDIEVVGGAGGSGYDTPDSPDSPDSGVFSGEDIDFTEIKRSTLRLTEEGTGTRGPIVGAFGALRHLHLTGEVANIVVFLRHLATPLAQLELVVEDPFERADWQELCALLCHSFGDSLQSLKVSASSVSRFNDLIRSTARAEFSARRLAMDGISSLPSLQRLEIDLPESVIYSNSDIYRIASACPNLEILRLSPFARFPIASGPPQLTLEGLAPLTAKCRRLHTLAVVVNALPAGNETIYAHTDVSSRSLFKLHMGHSWIRDPLQASILLSHLSPYIENLKWFHERNRPGFIETHSQGWMRVSEMLPHLQSMRLVERKAAVYRSPLPPARYNKAVDATVRTRERGVMAVVNRVNVDQEIQVQPEVQEEEIQVMPEVQEMEVQAMPEYAEMEVDAVPDVEEEEIDATPAVESKEISAVVSTETKYIHAIVEPEPEPSKEEPKLHVPGLPGLPHIPQLYVPQAVSGAISLAWRTMMFGPNLMTSVAREIWAMTPAPFSGHRKQQEINHPQENGRHGGEDHAMEVMEVGSPTEENDQEKEREKEGIHAHQEYERPATGMGLGVGMNGAISPVCV
ncbi:uncharacterized protein STEHIDRAFT_143705 [Stereum hirsutum FP-91666 SS1]|uniref:uncharacterized protein n=1 Tax=Stereum hirsutum (strain FP-91666) TaxID=721885 RepID=UPI000440E448|nr:uncharacterized protein STEHIDRAFT_143705 [Stereum hirsutum FP-91666 SS1]EIM92303.1 hypothetical protein STEHIDRAFT_143705 [Stereum hirsutum FP-91666 SS1]